MIDASVATLPSSLVSAVAVSLERSETRNRFLVRLANNTGETICFDPAGDMPDRFVAYSRYGLIKSRSLAYRPAAQCIELAPYGNKVLEVDLNNRFYSDNLQKYKVCYTYYYYPKATRDALGVVRARKCVNPVSREK